MHQRNKKLEIIITSETFLYIPVEETKIKFGSSSALKLFIVERRSPVDVFICMPSVSHVKCHSHVHFSLVIRSVKSRSGVVM